MNGPKKDKGADDKSLDERISRSSPNDVASNDALSDESFEVYLQRGSSVSQRYRAIEQEHPPAQLDASILARAQSELQTSASHKYRYWKKWTVPVALAASTLIAVSIVLESGMQHEVRSAAPVSSLARESSEAISEANSEPISEPMPPMPAQAPASDMANDTPDSGLPQRMATQNAAPRESAQEQFFAPDAPRPSAPPAKPNEEVVSAGAAMDAAAEREEHNARAERDLSIARAQSAKRESQASSVAVPERAPVPVRADDDAESEPRVAANVRSAPSPLRAPEVWLQQIRDLRKAGKFEDADREWRAFKAAFADFEVAADDFARPLETRE
jgi:hypothetical protein